MKNANFRKINNKEKEILNLLLKQPFPGRDQIREQIETCLVKDIFDSLGEFWGLEFKIKSSSIAKITQRVPVAGQSTKNGPAEILLHVIDGKIKELELVRYTDDSPHSFPDPEHITIKINN